MIVYLFGRYFAYRAGLARCPQPRDYYEPGLKFLDTVFGWTKHLRIYGGEHYPFTGPAILTSNHLRLDDPFVTAAAAARVTEGKARLWGLMRDDFFTGWPQWGRRILDPDEVFTLLGGFPVTREHAEEEQLAKLIDLLGEGKVFLTYPGRSRSRNGQFIEYRKWINSPGATSLFVARAQERDPKTRVGVVPSARTFNPASGAGAVAFGPPLFLEAGADRHAQREFDYRLVVAMSDLTEINMPQIMAALFFLRAIHGLPERVDTRWLFDTVMGVAEQIRNRLVDPSISANGQREFNITLRFFEKKELLRRQRKTLAVNSSAIGRNPEHGKSYVAQNPARYLANQILHFTDVTALIDKAAARN